VRVWQQQAYAAPALAAELGRHGPVAPREAGLATELCYGVLRTAAVLERAIEAHASSGRWRSHPQVRAHLLIAAYCICFLDRVPRFAAVSEAVGAISRASDRRVGAFANAVLRKLERGPSLEQALVDALPAWLRSALEQSLGAEVPVGRFLMPTAQPPPVGLCLGPGEDREQWLQTLRAAIPEAEVEAGAISPRCIRLRGAGDPRRLPGAGRSWLVQEEGAQCVALATGAQPGEQVLDACAGRGGKAFILADQVGPTGAVDAVDLRARKLAQLRTAEPRPGLVRSTAALDWIRAEAEAEPLGPYRRALVDAPCSGVGTLLRRPEIATRLTPDDPKRLGAVQVQITRAVARVVRTGGTLVFAVCSVLREETDEVVQALSEPAPGARERLVPRRFEADLGLGLGPDGCTLRLWPHVHGTDGYFAACFEVQRPGSDESA